MSEDAIETALGGHEPVLLQESLDGLSASRAGHYLDATFGGGGHSRAILEANPDNRLTALDRDPTAGKRAEAFAEDFPGRFSFHWMDFSELESLENDQFDGILFDLGVSSFQLDEKERGFSFRGDAPLDMRMDPTSGIPASEFLESAPEESLVEAIRDFGEEKFWRRIVRAILDARGGDQLKRTGSTAELIRGAVPAPAARGRLHPATRSFQGIRIFVNRELDAVRSALPAAFSKLTNGGRMVVISFHSLEDRIAKRFFRECAGRPVGGNDSRPQSERVVRATLPVTRPIRPSEAEIKRNPRSRSSRLRVLIKQTSA